LLRTSGRTCWTNYQSFPQTSFFLDSYESFCVDNVVGGGKERLSLTDIQRDRRNNGYKAYFSDILSICILFYGFRNC
jgi:hypothetical protein